MSQAATVTLQFDEFLYPEAALRAAFDTFADFATITCTRAGDHFVVDVTATAEVDGDLIGELCNFALANAVTLRAAQDVGATNVD